jgi:hypothetical protein
MEGDACMMHFLEFWGLTFIMSNNVRNRCIKKMGLGVINNIAKLAKLWY